MGLVRRIAAGELRWEAMAGTAELVIRVEEGTGLAEVSIGRSDWIHVAVSMKSEMMARRKAGPMLGRPEVAICKQSLPAPSLTVQGCAGATAVLGV